MPTPPAPVRIMGMSGFQHEAASSTRVMSKVTIQARTAMDERMDAIVRTSATENQADTSKSAPLVIQLCIKLKLTDVKDAKRRSNLAGALPHRGAARSNDTVTNCVCASDNPRLLCSRLHVVGSRDSEERNVQHCEAPPAVMQPWSARCALLCGPQLWVTYQKSAKLVKTCIQIIQLHPMTTAEQSSR